MKRLSGVFKYGLMRLAEGIKSDSKVPSWISRRLGCSEKHISRTWLLRPWLLDFWIGRLRIIEKFPQDRATSKHFQSPYQGSELQRHRKGLTYPGHFSWTSGSQKVGGGPNCCTEEPLPRGAPFPSSYMGHMKVDTESPHPRSCLPQSRVTPDAWLKWGHKWPAISANSGQLWWAIFASEFS